MSFSTSTRQLPEETPPKSNSAEFIPMTSLSLSQIHFKMRISSCLFMIFSYKHRDLVNNGFKINLIKHAVQIATHYDFIVLDRNPDFININKINKSSKNLFWV